MTLEPKQEQIKVEAKQILDNFAAALEKVKVEKKHLKKELGGFREEGQENSPNQEFRKKMFSNAPNKKENFIIAEKKKW
ncbi:MAG: hypothetical protein Q7S74_00365 [Nanoarchaeota archaeon]|nr:hypothetical protein [Nanoarchaeota archaeon]